jgi:hypothetical protein
VVQHAAAEPSADTTDQPPTTDTRIIPMSADKDRGIRRQKQKRAKQLKKQADQQRAAAGRAAVNATPAAQAAA